MIYKEDVLLALDCPIFVDLPRKTVKDKRYYLNLNVYRNLNPFLENQCKKTFKDAIEMQLMLNVPFCFKGILNGKKINITYKVYKQSARRLDKLNVVSIVSKYLLDALVELEVLEDDNDEIIKEEIILASEIDRIKPRVEVIFYEAIV